CAREGVWPPTFFFQAEDGIRDFHVTGVQTCALPIYYLFILKYKIVKLATFKKQQEIRMYKEYKQLNLPEIGKEILKHWESNNIFEKSISNRPASKPYTFYEGPPSANGMPGIHHVMARSIKDIFCRYKTLKGFQVKRKGGWDTHGL